MLAIEKREALVGKRVRVLLHAWAGRALWLTPRGRPGPGAWGGRGDRGGRPGGRDTGAQPRRTYRREPDRRVGVGHRVDSFAVVDDGVPAGGSAWIGDDGATPLRFRGQPGKRPHR